MRESHAKCVRLGRSGMREYLCRRLSAAPEVWTGLYTRQREIVGDKRRSMNRSGGSSAWKCVPAARRRQKYEPGLICNNHLRENGCIASEDRYQHGNHGQLFADHRRQLFTQRKIWEQCFTLLLFVFVYAGLVIAVKGTWNPAVKPFLAFLKPFNKMFSLCMCLFQNFKWT